MSPALRAPGLFAKSPADDEFVLSLDLSDCGGRYGLDTRVKVGDWHNLCPRNQNQYWCFLLTKAANVSSMP